MLGLHDMNWTRFWVPRDGSMNLDPKGYLADPEGKYSQNPSARTLESLVARPCLALLGEPGIGKSRTFRVHLDTWRGRHPKDEELLRRNLAFDADLERDVAGAPEFRRWLDGQTILHLFLDSLDEHHDGGATAVAKWLLRNLERGRGPVERLRLRLACRTAEWPGMLDAELRGFWKNKDDVGFYELAPLRRKDVELAAGADAVGFLREVEHRNAVALAIKPITLNFLLKEYERSDALPDRRCELYEKGCRILCEEASPTRRDERRTGEPAAERRLAIAARLAAITMLGRRALIWRGPDLGDMPSGGVLERELHGGSERTAAGEFTVGADEIQEVFTITGLFTARGEKGLGWAHQTYAEFLAAWFLKNRGLSVEEMLREVTNPNTPGRVVPELHETAAWLAGMSPEFFSALIHKDPETLLRSDFAMVGDAEREALVGTLLQRIDEKESLDRPLWDDRSCMNLCHPGLAEQLRPYIVDQSKYFMARRGALSIAEACGVVALQDALVSVVLGAGDNPLIRSAAANAVVTIGDRNAKQRLRPLVFGQCGPDPADDLKGYAMQALWPDDLLADELFTNLSAPRQNGGIYWSFIGSHLMERLPSSALPRALNWTCSLPARHGDSILIFDDVMDEILERAWQNLDLPGVLPAFAEAVLVRLKHYDGIFGERYRKGSPDADIVPEDPRRRLLVSALLELPSGERELASIAHDTSLFLPQDVPWIIEQMKGASLLDLRGRWAQVLVWLWHRCPPSFEIANAVITAWGEVDELRQALRSVLHDGSVDIDSPLADDLRRAEREEKEQFAKFDRAERERAARRREAPPAAELIGECLNRFDTGDNIQAGWELHHWMRVDPENKAHGHALEPDVTHLPGWKHAEEPTRARIADVGRAYLFKAPAEPEEWLSRGTFPHSEMAGYRYLYLLTKIDPLWVQQRPSDVWRRWTTILVAFPEEGKEKLGCKLISRAYRADPDSVLRVLRVLLEKENQKSEHLFVLRRMADCWDERFGRFLLNFARSADLKPRFWGKVIDELLDHDVAGTREYAATCLAAPIASEGPARERAHAAAHALIVHARDSGWPVVWPILRGDPAFGRQVLLTAVRPMRHLGDRVWGDALSEEAVSDFYLWLEEHFPGQEDWLSEWSSTLPSQHYVGKLKNTLINALVRRGTRAAVAAIERISKAVPGRDWTVNLVWVKEGMVQGTWTHRSISEILALWPQPAKSATDAAAPLLSVTKPASPSLPVPVPPRSLVLHLSDLHFGTDKDAALWSSQLAEDLTYELDCTHLDAVILSGDIANLSTPEEYTAAKRFLEALSAEFHLTPAQMIPVPGNHDLHWGLAKEAYKLVERDEHTGKLEEGSFIDIGSGALRVRNEALYQKRFEPFAQFYEDLRHEPYPLAPEEQGLLYPLPSLRLLVVGLNSAWNLDHHFKARASIHPEALSRALDKIRREPTYKDWLKIAVWHHPIQSAFEDRITDAAFLQRFAAAGFRVALHGHIHKAETNLFRYDLSPAGRRIEILSAGTFGAPVREWVPGYPLQYQLLRFEGSVLTVETRRREELNGAWKPDARWTVGKGKDPAPRYTIDV